MSMKPSIPDPFMSVDQFVYKYLINTDNLIDISSEINDVSFINSIAKLFTNPIEYIVSIRQYPINLGTLTNFIPSAATKNFIQVGNVTLSNTNSKGYPITKGVPLLDIIPNDTEHQTNSYSFKIDGTNFNFLDYPPFINADLYLPFIGFVELDLFKILNKYVKISYAINIDDGSCTCYIQIRTNPADDYIIIDQFTGQIAKDISLGGRDVGSLMRGLIDSGINVITGGMLGGVKGVALATINSMRSKNLQGFVPNPQLKQGNEKSSFYDCFSPYLIITKQNTANPNMTDFQNLKGYISNASVSQLSSVTGYTEIESIHLENLSNATDNEVIEIESLLKNGVIL